MQAQTKSLGLVAALALAGCGGGSRAGPYPGHGAPGDHSATLVQSIQHDGSAQAAAYFRTTPDKLKFTNVSCARARAPQTYDCKADAVIRAPGGARGTYFDNVSIARIVKSTVTGTCDSAGKCRWHPTGGSD